MSRRLKFALGGVGALAVGGVLYPVLESSFKSFNSLKGLGEAFNTRSESSWNDYRINLKDKKLSSRLDLKEGPNSLREWGLDLEKDTPFSFFSEELSNKNRSGSLLTIFSEVLKETKAKDLERKVDSEFEKLAKKHLGGDERRRRTILQDFQRTESSIKDWLKTKSKSGRNKAPEKSLSKEERLSLQKFYELFYELSNQGKELSTELSEVSGDEGEASRKYEGELPRLTRIQKSLRRINWTGKSINVQPTPSTRFRKASAWGDWKNSNPFQPFYESEQEFQKQLNGMNGSSVRITNLQQELSRNRSMFGGMGNADASFKAQEQKIQDLKANQSSEIEYHIGSKLLEFMSRLNRKSYS